MIKTIYLVVVVYNKTIKESVTLKSLSMCDVPNINILVIDNSTEDFNIENDCKELGYDYHSMNGNKGLSKAYNQALDIIIPKAKQSDIIVWLDDDTDLSKDYFEFLKKSSEDNNVDIFAPIIIGQNEVIYSPNEGRFMGSKFMKSMYDEINMKKINGINSCLAVRVRIYNNYRYTEDLFMDLTDNQFFDDMREREAKFCIMRTPIYQNFFQRGGNLDPTKIISRLRIKIKDFMVYSRKKGFLYLIGGLIKCAGWGVILGKQSKSLKVFTYCCIKGIKEFYKNISYVR